MSLGIAEVLAIVKAFRWWKRWRALRKLKKALKQLKEADMLDGKKTYIGIIIAALGFVMSWLGIGGEAEATQLVTNGAEVIGLLIATYGRWAAKP